MNGPRHLWSGEWEDESSARAAELAAQRGRAPAEEPEEPETPAATPKAKRPTLRERLVAFRRRHARQLRLGLLVGLLVLIGAGAAYAVGNAVTGGNNSHHQAANANGPQNAWLGIEMISSPSGGVMVARVDPKSPAQAAGIKPGDVITQIDTQPIVTPAIAAAAISGLEPGDHADIQVQRGAGSYTAHVTLARPPKTS
jgi:membrane-associated protease RseP (regulator of RpoE activity)